VTAPVARAVGAPLQKALYATLSADEPLRVLLGRPAVFDHVPETKRYPYVTIGEALETPDNAHGQFGRNVLLTVHVWSDQRGFLQGQQIVDRLVQLLDHQRGALAIQGHRVVSIRFENAEPVRDPDPDIRHVPVRFRVITEQE
jgi:hypothetical protein